jgi:hypothetical protein
MAERVSAHRRREKLMEKVRWQEARKARFLELQSRFLHLPPSSAAELEAERDGAEIFGPKESYGDSEVDAAYTKP